MESRYLVVSTSEAVATVTIDRPDKGNSLSPDVLAEIEGTFTELGADTDVHIIVLTGGEKMFGSDDNKERIEALLETLKKRGNKSGPCPPARAVEACRAGPFDPAQRLPVGAPECHHCGEQDRYEEVPPHRYTHRDPA